jgi:sugar lactone lactonase YvrE
MYCHSDANYLPMFIRLGPEREEVLAKTEVATKIFRAPADIVVMKVIAEPVRFGNSFFVITKELRELREYIEERVLKKLSLLAPKYLRKALPGSYPQAVIQLSQPVAIKPVAINRSPQFCVCSVRQRPPAPSGLDCCLCTSSGQRVLLPRQDKRSLVLARETRVSRSSSTGSDGRVFPHPPSVRLQIGPLPVQDSKSARTRRIGNHAVKCLAILSLLTCSDLLRNNARAQTVTLTPSLIKIAGTNSSGSVLFTLDYGTATSVALDTPNFAAFDALGDLYFSDTGSNCVRVIDTGGIASTIAGLVVGGGHGDTCNAVANPTPTPAQGLLNPAGVALAPDGDLYIADSGHNCVRMLPDKSLNTPSLVTAAGTCTATALNSQTPSPSGLALDSAGNLYIAIQNSANGIQQVLKHPVHTAATNLCVMAGATSIRVPTTCSTVTNNTITLSGPSGLTIDGEGSLVIADTGNKCVRKVAGMTTIQTIVGQCTNDSSGTANVTLTAPYGLQFDQTQALLISDGNQVLRHVIGSSTLTLLAGLSSNTSGPYDTTQDGKAGQLDPLNTPEGLAIDRYGNITVADSANHIVRQLFPNTVFSATPVNSPSAPQPITFVIDQSVNLAAAVGTDYSITSNTCSGSLSAGDPANTCQVTVTFTPTRPGVRNAALTLTDSISHTKVVLGLQGLATGSQLQFFPGVVNTVANGMANPVDLAVDIDSNAYILEQGTGGATADIKELVAASGTLQTAVAAGSGIGSDPVALARDSAGNLFVADQTAGTVTQFWADGSPSTTYLTGLTLPRALYVDGFGNLYVAQGGAAHNVVEYYASGGERTIAGSGSILNANGTAATAAQFVAPSGIHVDSNGVVYIADSGGHRVYAVDTSGTIHFVAGNGTTSTTTPSTPQGTALLGPTSLAMDASGDVFIADPPANIAYVVFATGSQLLQSAPILGNGTAASTGDGGPSPAAEVNDPLSLGVDGSGNTYVIDSGAGSVREISYPSPTINFGTVLIGATSPPITATLWSTGTGSLGQTNPLAINNANFLLDSSSSVTTCGTSLVAGGICEMGFVFKPINHGAQVGIASVANNSYLNPGTVNLLGNSSPPAPLTFVLPPETEIYGDAFPESVTLGLSGTAPTGTITFSTGTQTLCSFTGTMSATTTCAAPNSGLSVAVYPVTFTYSGDANYAAFTATTQLTVLPQPTVTTITTSGTPLQVGNPVTLTSSVNSALGAVTVGSVTFTDGNTVLGAGTLNASGMATLTTASLAVGTQTITATYPGTLNFSRSSASLTQGITAPPGAFTIAATPPNQYIRGAGSVTWQVTVTPTGGFSGPVALTCSGLPSDASCAFAMGTLTLTAATAAATTMTTTTTVNDAALKLPFGGLDLARQISCAFLLPFQMTSVLLAGFRRHRKARSRNSMRLWLMAAITFGILGLSGCNCFNTTFKTYTITVTGTSTLGGPPAQSTTVELSVGLQ